MQTIVGILTFMSRFLLYAHVSWGREKKILSEGKVSQVHSNLSVESILQKWHQIGGDITQR